MRSDELTFRVVLARLYNRFNVLEQLLLLFFTINIYFLIKYRLSFKSVGSFGFLKKKYYLYSARMPLIVQKWQ